MSFKLDVLAISRQPAAEVHAHDLFRADFDLFLQKRRPYMCRLFSCTSSTNRPEVIRLSSMNVKQNVPSSDTRLDGLIRAVQVLIQGNKDRTEVVKIGSAKVKPQQVKRECTADGGKPLRRRRTTHRCSLYVHLAAKTEPRSLAQKVNPRLMDAAAHVSYC